MKVFERIHFGDILSGYYVDVVRYSNRYFDIMNTNPLEIYGAV